MEIEYNRAVHRETASTPVERFAHAPDVLRASPSSESLRDAFRLETRRTQRQSDGTISLEGVRFEIPARYRHFREADRALRRAGTSAGSTWSTRAAGPSSPPSIRSTRAANADGRRAVVAADGPRRAAGEPRRARDGALPPLLKQILQEYSATGLPPAYLPKTPPSQTGDAS